jgi:ATP-dependent Clp protease adaptor protein ClpS
MLRALASPRRIEVDEQAQSNEPAVPMSDVATKPRTKIRPQTERPRLHKVILVNDDYTPRELVVTVLEAEFGMNEDQAYG